MKASHRFDNEVMNREEHDVGNDFHTPGYVLGPVKAALGGQIMLDPCTVDENPTGAWEWFCPPQDGSTLSWGENSVYCNPPYGRHKAKWAARCMTHGASGHAVILLIPAHTETKTWQRTAVSADWVCFVRGRVKMEQFRENRRLATWSHPSSLFGWNLPNPNALARLGFLVG